MIRFQVRIPSELHATLVQWAKSEQRSLNAQIVYLLTRAARERRADPTTAEDAPDAEERHAA